ncbi:Calcineurin-like phosphoesterase [Bacteroidales bacterium Barb6XT]|nr:Calcineurin-like phosphoesterase [Bacteroidales bacterium Barb6XT]
MRLIHLFCTALLLLLPKLSAESFNFIVASDLGRNGYYEQKPIAQVMGEYAEKMDIEFVAAVGDIHHFMGVRSVNDPLWMTNYELIYSHPELMIDWYAVAGNHEYRGNTQAVLDYTNVSRRWYAPAKYYARTVSADKETDCLLVFIDTTPLIDKYRKDSIGYPDTCLQDMTKQLQWIDSVLVNSTAKWKVVFGHHSTYADTGKSDTERADLQTRLAPILEGKADIYFSGHIHNFQHIQMPKSSIQYVVNSSASLSRKVASTEGTQFCSPEAGFTLCSVSGEHLEFYFINGKGDVIYKYELRTE